MVIIILGRGDLCKRALPPVPVVVGADAGNAFVANDDVDPQPR
jgi:hypothetical protein